MSQLAEGTFPFVVTSASFGADDRGVPVVQINGKFIEGPNTGRTTTYEDEINAKSALYVGRSCKAVGWLAHHFETSEGVVSKWELDTLAADAAAWIKATGGKTTAEIRHIELKRGKKYDKWQDAYARWVDEGRIGVAPAVPYWDKCNSIGYGAKPLVAPTTETRTDANDAMRRAMAEDNSAPTGGGYVAEGHGAPAGNDDDLPFVVSCSTVSTGEIARVLRGAL